MFLSFIVPVYNTEKYLRDCLDSLISQDVSKEDYEIICVNDGSTDGSLAILQEYAAENRNIHIINKENGGVASARNAGMDAAQGEYIWFVDSDDFVKHNCLGSLRDHVNVHRSDRVMIGTYVFRDGAFCVADMLTGKANAVNSHFYDSSVFNSVLRRTMLQSNDCRFHYPELTHGEDSIFMFEVVAVNLLCSEYDSPFYFYRIRPGSAMTSVTHEAQLKKLNSHFLAARIMKRHFDNGYGNPRDVANLLMSYIWYTMSECAAMPGRESRNVVREMRKAGLFPFRRPEACTHVRSYQTTRTDVIGKTFDWIYIHSHTRIGFFLLRLWHAAYSVYEKFK